MVTSSRNEKRGKRCATSCSGGDKWRGRRKPDEERLHGAAGAHGKVQATDLVVVEAGARREDKTEALREIGR